MTFKRMVEKIEESEVFKDWKKNNKKSYLANVFIMFDSMNKGIWNASYYNPETDKITSIVIDENNKVSIQATDDVFKKEDTLVKPLDMDKVNIHFDEAIEIAEKLKEEEYQGEPTQKNIVLLQDIEGHGLVWNLTFITAAYNTINVKIDASDGKIKKHQISSLLAYKAK